MNHRENTPNASNDGWRMTMTVKSVGEAIVTGLLAACALVVTALIVRREFYPAVARAGDLRPPTRVKNWQQFARGEERIGSPAAPVTVVVFSDYQCPFCKRVFTSLKSLSATHPVTFAVLHRNFPIATIHPFARRAAVAAACAAIQGRFAPYHDHSARKGSALRHAGTETIS